MPFSEDIRVRKASQEVEIDHLLAEEFTCDPDFANAFVVAAGLSCSDLVVDAAIAEPSLGGAGFGDLLVTGRSGNLAVALLVEDKISAAPATRQAARYAAHAATLRSSGFDAVWTVLVAPASYRGERSAFDASLDLEVVRTFVTSLDPARQAYRRGVIDRALAKRASTGVKIPDATLHDLKKAYLDHARAWSEAQGAGLQFPDLKDAYYDGDSWIVPIRSPALPPTAWLRHRMWTSTAAASGSVDLILSPVTPTGEERLRRLEAQGCRLDVYSKSKGFLGGPGDAPRQGLGRGGAVSRPAGDGRPSEPLRRDLESQHVTSQDGEPSCSKSASRRASRSVRACACVDGRCDSAGHLLQVEPAILFEAQDAEQGRRDLRFQPRIVRGPQPCRLNRPAACLLAVLMQVSTRATHQTTFVHGRNAWAMIPAR